MTTSKKSISFLKHQEKLRLLRVKKSKDYILNKAFFGLLNNHKWFEIFNWLIKNNLEFQIKTLLSEEYKNCDFIRELQKSSILISDDGDFIEFLEIDIIKIKTDSKLTDFLNSLNLGFIITQDYVEIEAYRK